MTDSGKCPCGENSTYEKCCGSFHRGEMNAVTSEQLMRSRYSAFVGALKNSKSVMESKVDTV